MWSARHFLSWFWTSRFWDATGLDGDIALPAESDFTGESGDLDGDTLNTGHKWETSAATSWSVTASTATPDTVDEAAVVTDMPDTADIEARVDTVGSNRSGLGVIARWNLSTHQGYLYRLNALTPTLYVVDDDGQGTQLAVASGTVADATHTLKIRCSGTVITCYVDGGLEITYDTVGDGTKFSTGKAGMYSVATSNRALDNFSATVFVGGRTTKNTRQWGMNLMPGTRFQTIVGGR